MQSIDHHSQAYYAGIVPVERMLEVLVNPYLRLCKAINEAVQPSNPAFHHNFEGQRRVRDAMLDIWDHALFRALQGILAPETEADSDRVKWVPGMTSEKRSELQQAVLGANFMQVNLKMHRLTLASTCQSS